ncbi:relaxase domain-containing protein [Micromonospora sp. NPDC047620]|uniref:relaxase domain-containing protein n=1 Tax=Micromonospora sp. NPDC047620 TaxID=3364251 RepID=UPI00371985D7
MQDQKWRTLAGRPVHASVVALSELYNATLADRITGTLGLVWEARERGRDRNPAWELAPVSEELIEEFSSRSREIEDETQRLIARHVDKHGSQPSKSGMPGKKFLQLERLLKPEAIGLMPLLIPRPQVRILPGAPPSPHALLPGDLDEKLLSPFTPHLKT